MFELILILARRRRLFLSVTAAIFVPSIVAIFLWPPLYTSHASLLPPQQSSSLSTAILSQMGNLAPLAAAAGGGFGIKNPGDLYVAMLTSRTVEDALIKRFRLQRVYDLARASDARRKLESRTAIVSSPKDGLIRIAVEDRNPLQAAAMANAYIEELKKLSESLAVTEAAQRRLFFQKQMDAEKLKLAEAENEFRRAQEGSGLLQLDGQAKALIESAALLRAQVTAKEVELRAIGAYATDDNPEMALAKEQLTALRAELSRLASGSGNEFLVSKSKLPTTGLEHVRRLREVKYHEAVFELLAKQLELAKLDEARQGGSIQVVDTAIPSDRRSFPRRMPMVVLAGLAGLTIATLAAFLTERWKSGWEAREKLFIFAQSMRGR